MTEDSPDYYLDLRALDGEQPAEQPERRPWVGILFECCGVYARLYRNPEGTMYLGRCPRCQRRVRLRVGPGGTSSRFFRAE